MEQANTEPLPEDEDVGGEEEEDEEELYCPDCEKLLEDCECV